MPNDPHLNQRADDHADPDAAMIATLERAFEPATMTTSLDHITGRSSRPTQRSTTARRQRSTQPRRRWMVAAAAALAVAFGGALLVVNGDTPTTYAAGWTPQPAAMSASDRAEIEAACEQTAMVQEFTDDGAVMRAAEPGEFAAAAADRRGDVAVMALYTPDTFADCALELGDDGWQSIMPSIPAAGASPSDEVVVADSADDVVLDGVDGAVPAGDDGGEWVVVDVAGVGGGSISTSATSDGTPISWMTGAAEGAVSISVDIEGLPTATVTPTDGQFIVWFPGDASLDVSVTGVDAAGNPVD